MLLTRSKCKSRNPSPDVNSVCKYEVTLSPLSGSGHTSNSICESSEIIYVSEAFQVFHFIFLFHAGQCTVMRKLMYFMSSFFTAQGALDSELSHLSFLFFKHICILHSAVLARSYVPLVAFVTIIQLISVVIS